MMRDEIKKIISHALQEAFPGVASPDFSVDVSENFEHGDYATNAPFLLAKILKKPPMEVARVVAERLTTKDKRLTTNEKRFLERAEVAAPGFINFWVRDEPLLKKLEGVLDNPNDWGKSDVGKGKTVVVEYFQLNIAKRPHIGHLRSAVIGDAIKRMLLTFGYHAISDTHVGDWGTQFGILLLAHKETPNTERKTINALSEDPFAELEKLYQEENMRIEQNPERRELAKEEFAKLERGDSENRKIWRQMVDVSMKKLEESAKRLQLLPFDEHRGESAYEEMMPNIVSEALEKEVAKKTDDGAVVIDLSSEGLDEAVLIKSDGASTYLLRDLATIQYRKERWNFWKNLYVVDVRQAHHFKQVFRVAEILGFEGLNHAKGGITRSSADLGGESQHIEFGFMSLPEGALSTRKGTAISLDVVLDEARRRALAVIKEKNPELVDAEKIAEQVGIGALKYFDLSHHRKSDIVFRWDDALSFEGNTGPYLQYTYARLNSILRKGEADSRGSLPAIATLRRKQAWLRGFARTADTSLDGAEHRLLVSLLRLSESIEDALKDFTPNILANYLYHLAELANNFYHSHPVMQEADEQKKEFRIALVAGVVITLSNGLWCLGIDAPEEM